MRHTSKLALCALHSDFGSLGSGVFVAFGEARGVSSVSAGCECLTESSCRRRRRTDVIALYPWHSDIGSPGVQRLVASVKLGR
jgi:hypothetical protein